MLQRRVQQTIRAVHRTLLRRPLPQKLSLCLHSTAGCEQRLDELLSFLGERGYAFTSPDEFLISVGNVCFLSFDDNFRSWLHILPIFERYRIHVTFYVNSWPFRDRVSVAEARSYLKTVKAEHETTLSTAELREIAAAGHIIGAHTHTHPVLTALPTQAAREEIRISRDELAALLGHAPQHFAYTFGMRRHFNEALRNYCLSVGFTTVANTIPGMQYGRSRPDSLHRSVWFLDQPLAFNLENVCVDGRVFAFLTGRSAVGGSFS
jgi:peptidoglycan/xylan/chitin deacetylase (PgdA/CDA1 family)